MTAHVELEDGLDFVAEIANLTQHSLFIRTDRVLPFRSQVTITFFSVSVKGELALASDKPAGWLVVFNADVDTLARIQARIPDVDVLPRDPSLLPERDPTETLPPEGEALPTLRGDSMKHALADALRSTGGIPASSPFNKPLELDEPLPGVSEPRSEIVPSDLLDLPIEDDEDHESRTMPVLERPSFDESKSTDTAPSPLPVRARQSNIRTSRKRDATRRDNVPATAVIGGPRRPPKLGRTKDGVPATPVNGNLADIPILAPDDSTVVFTSMQQYEAQHRMNIAHGSILVRSRPMPIGTEKTLRITVPGIPQPYTLKAKVILSTDDSIGLSIDEFEVHASALEQLALR